MAPERMLGVLGGGGGTKPLPNTLGLEFDTCNFIWEEVFVFAGLVRPAPVSCGFFRLGAMARKTLLFWPWVGSKESPRVRLISASRALIRLLCLVFK